MALLKRELYRQVRGPEVTHADRCTLAVEYQKDTMDISDYLRQGGQTAGHRELWRLLRAIFDERADLEE
jgi:hypothetical protein